jgi:hypothetical protein
MLIRRIRHEIIVKLIAKAVANLQMNLLSLINLSPARVMSGASEMSQIFPMDDG